jgi:hypothetical protein
MVSRLPVFMTGCSPMMGANYFIDYFLLHQLPLARLAAL